MTTVIQGVSNGGRVEVGRSELDGHTYLNTTHYGVSVPTDKLLAALDASGKLAELSAEVEQWQNTAAKLEHQRDDRLFAAETERDKLRAELGRRNSILAATSYKLQQVEAKLAGIDELGCGCDEADTNLSKALAERDALAKTVQRVREAVEAGREYYGDVASLEALDAALDPEPAFVLPTEVPARIVAVKSSTGDEKELTLFTDGDTTWWADIEDWGPFWTRSQVMDQFTGHRLLDGGA